MSSITQLGRLRLRHSKAKLQLEATTFVTISPPQHLPATDLQAKWVCRGRGLHMLLRICVHGQPLGRHLAQHLANDICAADLWKQLRLKASVPVRSPQQDSDAQEGDGVIEVRLTYSSDSAPPHIQLHHMLSVGASAEDVRPPGGVEVVHLEAVKLLLEISSVKRRARKRKRNIEEQESRALYAQTTVADPDLTDQVTGAEEEDMLMLHSQEELILSDAPQMPLAGQINLIHNNLPAQLNLSSIRRYDSVKPLSVGDCLGNAGPHDQDANDIHRILELIDATLRLTICDKRSRARNFSGDLKIEREDFVTKLATAAPSLWSPGYRQAVSEQATFLPTLGHAFSQSFLLNARSASLRQKLARLAGPSPHDATSPEPVSVEDSQASRVSKFAYKSVSVELWNLLQRELFDPAAAIRLKPLHSKCSNMTTPENNEHLILEEEIERLWQYPEFSEEDDLFGLQEWPQRELSDDELLWEFEDRKCEDEDRGIDLVDEMAPYSNDHDHSSFLTEAFDNISEEVSDDLLHDESIAEEQPLKTVAASCRGKDDTSVSPAKGTLWLDEARPFHVDEGLVADAGVLFGVDIYANSQCSQAIN